MVVTTINIEITLFWGMVLCGLVVANIEEQFAASISRGGGQGSRTSKMLSLLDYAVTHPRRVNPSSYTSFTYHCKFIVPDQYSTSFTHVTLQHP